MPVESDPFVNHPDLRGKIIDPEQSTFRDLNIALIDQKMRQAGAGEDWRHTDTRREATRREALEGRMDEDLWLFAYGSLMWDPAFYFAEVRTAAIRGYRRSFCMKSVLARGTPEYPGLMAGLVTGGECHGLAFRIERVRIEQETRRIWTREMLHHAYAPRFVEMETPFGSIEGLAFVVDPTAKSYLPGLTLEETARYMATGTGIFGTSQQYLENLAEHFEALGIEDTYLFQLRDLTRRATES